MLIPACWDDERPCPDGEVCDSSTLVGEPHGVRDDGTVDVSVQDAWPNRRAEAPALTAEEIAGACTLLAACYSEDTGDAENDRTNREMLLHLCLMPEAFMFWEERAVPTSGINERWAFEARAILEAGADCDAIVAIQTERPSQIRCEEAGCWWSSIEDPIPSVSCEGTVSTLSSNGQTYERDCARGLQDCDPNSPTGCTDRAPTACTPPAKDRCEGDVRLGCDGNGRVSFHDCTRLEGGRCAETDDGVKCVYPDAEECEPGDGSVSADVLSVCVLGRMVDVDCGVWGLTAEEKSCRR